ncbi:tautomerase family protein [Actinacidiphila glaucinigra]|uniref:tautomerase family protein n=1 Tax=Actinacidiphila glaucinigra TaxID=235986 RepID=UPI0033B2E8B0
MPVHHVVTPRNTVSAEQKAELAADITRLHSESTGTPTSFVHVAFAELPEDSVHTDAAPSRPLKIEATARAGHADAEKTRLATEISAADSRISDAPESRILVMCRTPRAGDEGDWIAGSG